ncbi:MAG: hypothetical protein R3E68_10055 [Burkholderiaceae bacterium]
MKALALVWGLAILMPYPALPVGASTGVQFAHLMIALLLPLALINRASIPRAWFFYLFISTAQITSLLVHGMQQVDLNATIINLFALLAIPVTALMFRFQPRAMLTGVALMMGVHGVIGLIQYLAFQQNEFPFGWLYVNPSFAQLTPEWLLVYAEYVKRPFGLFPEPSSLLAAVGPWLVMLIAAMFDTSRQDDGKRCLGPMPLMLTAVALMGTLMIMSASGALLFVAGGATLVLAVMTYRNGTRRPVMTGLVIVTAIAAGIALIGFLGARADSEFAQASGSWFERLSSIRLGLDVIARSDLLDLWLGYGAGHVSYLAGKLGALDAVQSWMLSHIVANGLFGAIGLLVCALLVLHAVSRTSDPLIWLICLAVWVAGPLVVTAYQDLFGIWAFIALPLAVADRAVNPRVTLRATEFRRQLQYRQPAYRGQVA